MRITVFLAVATATLVLTPEFPLLASAAWQTSDGAPQCQVISIMTDEAVPPGPEGGGLTINATFDANITGAQQVVIQQALSEWQAIITNTGQMANPYPITFLNGPLVGPLAQAGTVWNGDSGALLSCTITIDNDGSSIWWLDPSPATDTEFDSDGHCKPGQPCAGRSDLLTVIRHEIGHAMGWVGPANPLVSGLVTGGATFDQTRLNIALEPGATAHASGADHPHELMNPTLSSGMRRAITLYPSASLPARAFDDQVTMKYIDDAFVGTSNGSADNPYRSLTTATQSEAANSLPFLMIPGDFDEVSGTPLIIGTARTITVARGGSAVVR